MSGAVRPQVAQMVRHFHTVIALLDEQARRLRTTSFVVNDQTDTVEVAMNGHRRLTGLTIDPQILSLGAHEVTRRINEAIGAATDFAIETVDADIEELEGRIAEVLEKLQNLPPPG